MNKLCLAITISVLQLLCTITNGWTEDTKGVRPNSLLNGVWAVQFSIEPFCQLDNFEGQFSVKRHIKDMSACRLGISYQQSTEYLNHDYYRYYESYDDYYFKTSLVYLVYPRKIQIINLYLGFGPEYGYRRDGRSVSRYDGSYVDLRYGKQHSIGGVGVLGFEWFAFKQISIFAEYNPRFYYMKIRGYDNHGYEGHGWYANTSQASFGLSVYF